MQLQQCLPFTVLKLNFSLEYKYRKHYVATVLTVYGIETLYKNWLNSNARVATVLTVYGIETIRLATVDGRTL